MMQVGSPIICCITRFSIYFCFVAIGCPQGEMLLTPSFYSHVTHSLMALASGKVAVVLEGGYCLESLADSAASTLRTLLGDPPVPITMRYPINRSVVESVLDAISVLRPYWNNLRFQGSFNRHENDVNETHRKRHYPMIEYRGQVELLPKPEKYPTRDCYPVQSEDIKESYSKAIQIFRKFNENNYRTFSLKRTCLINMPDFARRHAAPQTHPERPNRILFLWKHLKTQNLLSRCHIIENNNRPVTEEQIRLCHTEDAIDKVRQASSKNYKDLREYECNFDSLYFTKDTFEVAKLAAGCLLQVVDCVLTDQCLNGFACVRPPGHHASMTTPSGFCYFNNVSIAANYAIQQYNLQRVLILDWDIHHGDGTQNIVKNNDKILFISLHRFDCAQFYPENLDANYHVGKNVVNIPWSGGPMGDKEYLAAFFNIVLPIAYNFNPELVLVSAGFDSARGNLPYMLVIYSFHILQAIPLDSTICLLKHMAI